MRYLLLIGMMMVCGVASAKDRCTVVQQETYDGAVILNCGGTYRVIPGDGDREEPEFKTGDLIEGIFSQDTAAIYGGQPSYNKGSKKWRRVV